MIQGTDKRFFILAGAATVLTLGSVGFLLFHQLPQLSETRTLIDGRRASIVVAKERRNNLQALVAEADNLVDQQKKIDAEIWAFINEDQFFQVWPALANQRSITINEPTISDATPGANPVPRTASIVMSGPTNQVLAAIDDIQTMQPTVAITSITLSSSSKAGQVTATIKAMTLWR